MDVPLCSDRVKIPVKASLKKVKFRVPDTKRVMYHSVHAAHGTYLTAAIVHGSGVEAWACGALLLGLILNYFLHFDQEPIV
jgi:hypothetical protein